MTDALDPAEPPPGSSAAPGRGALVRSSALVGVLRVVALLYALGQTRLSDVYTVANTMPNLVYELLLGGVLSATLVPIFAERVDDEDGGTSAVVSVAGVVLVAVTAAGIVTAPAVIDFFARQVQDPSAGEVAAYRDVGTALLRFFMPQVFFYGLITIVTALLHARRSFAAPAYAPILNNLVVTAMFLTLPAIVGVDTAASDALVSAVGNDTLVLLLGVGTTIGVVVMALAMVPALVRQRVPLRFDPNWRHPAVKAVVRLSGWTVGYVIANQIALLVVTVLANGTDGGPFIYISAYAFFQLPHGLFAVSIMTTFLPELAEAARRGEEGQFRQRFLLGLRMMLLVVLPASAGYMALSQPIVGILPLAGASVEVTASILVAFAAGLAGFSAYLYALRGFYARQDTRTPFLINLGENAANIALAIPFVAWWGINGLAAAYSVAYLLAAIGALAVLSRRVGGGGDDAAPAGALARMALAAAACGLAAWFTAEAVGPNNWVQVVSGALAGGGAYLVVLLALRVEEVDTLRRLVKGRLARR